MKKILLFALIALTFGFAGCSKDEDIENLAGTIWNMEYSEGAYRYVSVLRFNSDTRFQLGGLEYKNDKLVSMYDQSGYYSLDKKNIKFISDNSKDEPMYGKIKGKKIKIDGGGTFTYAGTTSSPLVDKVEFTATFSPGDTRNL